MRTLVLVAAALVVAPAAVEAQATEAPIGAVLVDTRPGAVPRAEDFETARTVGTAFGMRAGAFGTSAVLVNPANLPLSQQYYVEAFAGYAGREGSFSFGSVVADSSTSRVRAGVASRGIFGGPSRGYRGHEQRLAVGTAIGDAFGIGLGFRYMRLRSRGQTSDGYPEGAELRAYTLDAALRVTPVEGLHIAALGYNLIRTGSLLAPVQLGGGIVYQHDAVLQVGVDFLADLSTFDDTTYLFGLAVEGWVKEKVPLRLGYRRDQGRALHAMTFGVGYVEPRFGVELSLRQEFGPERQALVLFSARYVLDVQSQ